MFKKIIFLLLLSESVAGMSLFCQIVDTTSFTINTRLNFYSLEKSGEVLIHVPQPYTWQYLNVVLDIKGIDSVSWKGTPGRKLLRIPININCTPGNHKLIASIIALNGKKFGASTFLTILNYKSNEVKTDRLTGGLIIDQRIFFPFGFYCYSPVYPSLPEEEAVKGFNMISPYQNIITGNLKERKAYMDRCAQIGMKVHYNLLSLSAGGSISSKNNMISDSQKRAMLIDEIKTFMDHPALLAWYISDEPNGNKTPPEKLEETYRIVKETDPWHPVSMVFMAPFIAAKNYANALDIVMADPYPVPKNSINLAGETAFRLRSEFEGRKPVWIVPQAFGGGEWWDREPTVQEMRNMTYQAIVNGASGIQYFIRHGLNSFPKSTAAWNECGKISIEVAEIAPWLLSDEKSPVVKTSSPNIQLLSAFHHGQLLIIAVNKANYPQRVDINIPGSTGNKIRVLFENRSMGFNSGFFSDWLTALGTQVYLITITSDKDSFKPFKDNLIRDPGFEDTSSPGVPASCYAWNEGDRGSTFFLDTREHLEGNHSLRLITPQENKGIRLRFLPINVVKGRTYTLSVWARTDSGSYNTRKSHLFELGLGEYGSKRFNPGNEWKRFVTSVTIPSDSIPSPRANLILRMPSQGIAWFDMIQIFEAEDLKRCINPEIY